MNIKQILQDQADNAAATRKAKKEGRELMALDAAKRTPEQDARLTAVFAELTALEEAGEQIAETLANARRLQDDERHAPTLTPERTPEARDTFASFGEFMQAVAYAALPGRGTDPRLFAAASGLNSGVPSEGGFLVRHDWSDQLLQRAVEAAVLLPACTEIPIGDGADGIDMPAIDEASRADGSRWGGVQMYWAAEAGAVTATKPKFARREMRLEELKGLCYATERNLRDATSLEALITNAFTSEFAFKIDDAIFRGDGAGKPLGIITAPALVTITKETNQPADTVVYENIVKMFSAMSPRSLPNAVWYYNHGDVFPQLATMGLVVGAGGAPVFLPATGVAGAPYGTLMGRPLRPLEQASAKGDLGDLVFADMSQYLVIRKGGLKSASSVHVRFIYDEMTFKFTVSINGQPVPSSALTPYKGAQTTSPFVALGAR